MENKRILYYVKRFTEIYDGQPWYGDSLTSKLKDLSDDKAFYKASSTIHSIAEVISHMTYWRKELIGQLQEKPFSTSEESPENWLSHKALTEKGWDALREEFDESQHKIVTLLSKRDDRYLNQPYKENFTIKRLIKGIIDHDIYHIGQLGILRKWLP